MLERQNALQFFKEKTLIIDKKSFLAQNYITLLSLCSFIFVVLYLARPSDAILSLSVFDTRHVIFC